MAASTSAAMRIKDRSEYASKPRPLTFPPDAIVFDAVAAMCEKNYGSVVVVDPDDKVIGVMTERDIMRKLVHGGMDAKTTKISQIMTDEPRVAREDDDLVDWLRIMSNERFRRLPIVDDEGRIKAVFTQGDFVSYTWPDLMGQAKELVKASIGKNWHFFLIGGGIMLYTLLMIVVLRGVT
ncbi:CBS domain-containing protein [Parasulfitobacter algicola]|uniref:CBS domain-containing protein n=1 Tax=Parasulfitobacter algicola TaxID=2614809 RepID=A0ABX2ITY3_9RHOB|nr:CBS domain-containing protein [Sulfitobacter algicola]NSX56382.1 CBS domain-containing protein [Sulfitobacter algicola]